MSLTDGKDISFKSTCINLYHVPVYFDSEIFLQKYSKFLSRIIRMDKRKV